MRARAYLGAIATVVTAGSLLAPSLRQPLAALEVGPKTVIDEVWQIVNTNFVDRGFNQNDWQAKRLELLEQDYGSREEAYAAIREALKTLDDPYTRFLDPEQFEALNRQTSGELSGVGIRLAQEEDSEQLVVVEPIPDSPAAAAGVASGDAIIAIDERPTAELGLEKASELIRGRSGTSVTLRLLRAGRGEFEVVLTRAKIELPAVNYELRTEADGQRIGYIRLDEFSGHATEQMRVAIADLGERDADAFVLDLRGNPGGLLFASIEIARLWYDSGEIVRTQDRQGGDRSFAANQTAVTDLPLAVLVDGRSASASEILAGALQDNDRAVIVGTRTFGKGTVQSVQALSDGSGLAVTISQYFPPSGVEINKRGIAPDIEVTLDRETRRRWRDEPDLRGTAVGDPQYARALNALATRQVAPTAERARPGATAVRDRASAELLELEGRE